MQDLPHSKPDALPTHPNPRLTSLSHGGGCGCKIAPAVLQDILRRTQTSTASLPIPKELLVGLETSDDAAVYQLNEHQALVATTDFFMPIVDDPFEFGRIAATNALSDVYAMGGQPILALAIVAMPVNTLDAQTIADILRGGQSVCQDAGVVLAGGHTIDCVEPIYGLVALGLVEPQYLKKNSHAQVGDCLILGKPLGVGVMSAALKKNQLSPAAYRHMIAATTQLNRPGSVLAKMPGVHALTDVTGFGLLGHALEMAKGSEVQLLLNWDSIALLPEVEALIQAGHVTGASARNWASYAEHVALSKDLPAWAQDLLSDPQTSGGLLVSCAPEQAKAVLSLFQTTGFHGATVIGHVQAKPSQGTWVGVH